MWTNVEHLKDVLDLLPEPIMIIGNRFPDGDSLGACAAVLDYLRTFGTEAYIHCVEEPNTTLSWMLDEGDTCPKILDDYQSLIVVDDQVDSDRLGIPIKEDIPIVCIDHHIGNFPPELSDIIKTSNRPTVYTDKNIIYFFDDKPATACVLIDEGVFHPYLWVSLYTDTVGFTVRCGEAVNYAARLTNAIGLSDKDIEAMLLKLQQIARPEDLQSFLNGSIYMMNGEVDDEPISAIICCANAEGSLPYYKMMGTLRQFADVVAFINEESGKTSLRSRKDNFNVLEVAREFGGGGHIRASGATLDSENILAETQRLVGSIADKIDNARTIWYV